MDAFPDIRTDNCKVIPDADGGLWDYFGPIARCVKDTPERKAKPDAYHLSPKYGDTRYPWTWQKYADIPNPLTTVAVWPSIYFAHWVLTERNSSDFYSRESLLCAFAGYTIKGILNQLYRYPRGPFIDSTYPPDHAGADIFQEVTMRTFTVLKDAPPRFEYEYDKDVDTRLLKMSPIPVCCDDDARLREMSQLPELLAGWFRLHSWRPSRDLIRAGIKRVECCRPSEKLDTRREHRRRLKKCNKGMMQETAEAFCDLEGAVRAACETAVDLEIIALRMNRCTDTEIAARLGITQGSVSRHRAKIEERFYKQNPEYRPRTDRLTRQSLAHG
jgi:hypothetical protein